MRVSYAEPIRTLFVYFACIDLGRVWARECMAMASLSIFIRTGGLHVYVFHCLFLCVECVRAFANVMYVFMCVCIDKFRSCLCTVLVCVYH